MKRYIVDRTNKAEERTLEEQSEKTENCLESVWNEIQLKGPQETEVDKKSWKETWGFTSTETIKAFCRRGSLGVGNFFISNTFSIYCHHQNDSALRWAAV